MAQQTVQPAPQSVPQRTPPPGQQATPQPAAPTAPLEPAEARRQALAAMAEASRYGREGTRVVAGRAKERIGTAGRRARERSSVVAASAGRRAADTYGALRGAQPPYTWRTGDVAALMLMGVAAGVVLGAGFARRVASIRADLGV